MSKGDDMKPSRLNVFGEPPLLCPECKSDRVTATAEQMWMVNTGGHYCHSVKEFDDAAKSACLDCDWRGVRADLVTRDIVVFASHWQPMPEPPL